MHSRPGGSSTGQARCRRTDEGEIRAGSRVLSLFENPLNARILRAHAAGPQRLAELPAKMVAPPTTLRAALSNLRDVGALERRARGGSRVPATAERPGRKCSSLPLSSSAG